MLCFRFSRTGLLDSASETFWLGIHFQVVGAVFRSHEFAKNNKKISKCDFQKKNPLQRSYIFAKFRRIFLWQNHVPACSKLSVSTEMQGRLESATTHEESPKFSSSRCSSYQQTLCALFVASCIIHFVSLLVFPKKVRCPRARKGAKYAWEFSRKCNLQHSRKYILLGNRLTILQCSRGKHAQRSCDGHDGMMLLPRTMFFTLCLYSFQILL